MKTWRLTRMDAKYSACRVWLIALGHAEPLVSPPGQLSVYLRMLDVPIPVIYGRSRREPVRLRGSRCVGSLPLS